MSKKLGRPASELETQIGHLIRMRRKQLGMTLQQLGDGANLSVGYLSQVERDFATPTLAALAGIARALDVSLDYFISEPTLEQGFTQAATRPRFSIAGSPLLYEKLGAQLPGNQLSSFILNAPAGYEAEAASHEGDELIYILEGSIILCLDGQEFTMVEGDSLHYRGTTPHSWANRTDKPARLLWVGSLAVFNNSGLSNVVVPETPIITL